jgi:hypothetical protein
LEGFGTVTVEMTVIFEVLMFGGKVVAGAEEVVMPVDGVLCVDAIDVVVEVEVRRKHEHALDTSPVEYPET